MTNWDAIRKEFETSDITMADLARKHDVKVSTLRSRKNREKWTQRNATKNATQRKTVATPKQPKLVIDNDDLTEQQKMFCIYYLQSFNATKAYRQAYVGSTYDAARANSIRLIAKDSVKKEITRLKAELQQEVHIDTKDLINELARQLKADVKDFVEFGQEIATNPDTGDDYIRSYMRFKDMDEVDGTLIDNIKLGRDGVSLQLPNKQKALEMLLKYTDDTTSKAEDRIVYVNSMDKMREWVDANGDNTE